MTLELVKVAVDRFKAAEESVESVVTAVEGFLQDGLKGNRAVDGTVWSVVSAATRAFPIQLSPAVEKAQAVAGTCSDNSLVATWILQALADGSLVTLLQKLQSQPQILTAYDRKAPVRQPSAVQQLVELLQQLKGHIQETPYDRYQLQQQNQQQQPSTPIHIQTEHDLQRHSDHSDGNSSSKEHHNHIQPASSGAAAANNAASSGQFSSSSSSSSRSAQELGAAAGRSRLQQAESTGPSSTGKKLLLGAFGRRHSSQISSSKINSQKLNSSGTVGLQQHVSDVNEISSVIRVQLVVPDGDSQTRSPEQQQLLVALRLQVLPETANNSSSNNSSSSKFLGGAAAGAVKGLLHGWQQSATNSLQQSAAAGQDLGGAVAAAGGAMAAAISQPFAAVRGFASAASGRVSKKKSSSSSSSRVPAGNAADIAAAAVDSSGKKSVAERRGLRSPNLCKPQQQQEAVSYSSTHQMTNDQLVQVHLTSAADTASEQLLHCVITVLGETAAAAAAAGSTTPTSAGSSTSSPRGWGAKSLMQRINSSVNKRGDKDTQQQQQHQLLSPGSAAAAAAGDASSATEGDVLEGDMWSVLARLRKNSNNKLAVAAAAGEGAVGDQNAAAATAAGKPAAAAAEQLDEQGQQLHQQLLTSCQQVAAAAAATKGCLGDENAQLLECIELLKQLLNHGLKQATAAAADGGGPAAGGGSKGATGFGSWLGSRTVDAFGVLQSLQQGSKHQPRLMLGADSISAMQAAKVATAAVKLDLWLRASLNEQLLGIRLSTLVNNPNALQQWYHHNALLMQQKQMHEVLQQITELSRFRFALLVEAPNAAAAGSSAKGAMVDARKLLGGFSRSLGALRAGSSSSQAAAAAQGSAADRTSSAAAADDNNSSNIPTFLWAALGSNSSNAPDTGSSNPSATAPAPAGTTGNASIFKRGQRRLANILEVRVPPPNSAAVLSPVNSCALSPVSTPEDAAYAEWWSPNSSWKDMAGAAAAAAGSRDSSWAGRESGLDGSAIQDIADFGDANVYSPPGASRSSSAASISSRSTHAAAAAGAAAAKGVISTEETNTGVRETGVTTVAAKQLEQDLAAAMSAPLPVLLDRNRRSSSSSKGGGSSSGGDSKSAGLHRSSSSGWDAAVAAARSRDRRAVGTSVGVYSLQQYNRLNMGLQRRSRSPDANWPAAAAVGHMIFSNRDNKEGEAVATATAGDHAQVVAASSRKAQVRHFHKRSSSLNDLPDLAALFDAEDVQL